MSTESIKKYQCPMSKNYIEIRFNKENAIFDNCNIDNRHIKLFFNILKECIDDLITRKISRIVQSVDRKSWEEYLSNNSKWNIIFIDKFTDIYTIDCDIYDALSLISEGFGIKN